MKLSPAILNDGRYRYFPSRWLGIGCAVLLASSAQAAFDPNAGSDVPPQTLGTLPDTTVLRTHTPVRPLYMDKAISGTSINNYATTLKPVQMPRPLYPERALNASGATPVAAPAPNFSPAVDTAPAPAMTGLPPVDASTQARAQQIMQSSPSPSVSAPAAAAAPFATATPASSGFIAPAPVLASPAPSAAISSTASPPAASVSPVSTRIITPTATPAPLALPAPAVAAAPEPTRVVVEQPTELSSESRTILSKIPSKLDTKPTPKTSKVSLQRVSPEIQNVLGKDAAEESYESVGLSIKMRRPGLDTTFELNQAYTALMGGDTEHAIDIYKNILSTEPRNEDALFGLAATYHRLGHNDQARSYYGMLLKENPDHREGLNNFLVLMSDESPQDALPELERLELRNPDFSPIPAQIAVVLDRLGYGDKAEDKMLRAIELAPDNLTYKYNLAVMLDRHQKYADATAMYRMLIDASLRGESVPASTDSMQKRLNYLTTAMMEGRVGS